jgi:hypothetical protein
MKLYLFKAYHPGLVPARPGDKFERTRADGMLGGLVKVVWGLQVGWVVQHVGWHGSIRLSQVETHRVLVEDLNCLNGFYRALVPIAANSRVFDVLDIQLHRFRVNLTTVVKQHAFAQPEHPGHEILVRLPALGDTRDNIALLIIIGQAGVHSRCRG